MGAIIAPGSYWLSIRRPIYLKAHFTRNAAQTIGIAGLATLVLVCATVCPASARGGGGGGGGGHGGPSPASGHGGPSPASGHGGSMMNGVGPAGMSTTSSATVSCRNNKASSHCRVIGQPTSK
jgi:hypothetical protein